VPAEFLCQTNDAIFLAVKRNARVQDLPFELGGCLEVRLHPRAAILTLVGEGIAAASDIAGRAVSALKQIPTTVVTDVHSRIAVNLIVPRMEMERCVAILHREFFRQVDPAVFFELSQAVAKAAESSEPETRNQKPETKFPAPPLLTRPTPQPG
jgi:hypothetical protein